MYRGFKSHSLRYIHAGACSSADRATDYESVGRRFKSSRARDHEKMDLLKKDEYFMKKALFQAEKAFSLGEVPVGAVLVYRESIIIATAFNQRELRKNPLAHAELIGIEKACNLMDRWRLDDITLYVTLEPCPMCAGAAVQARIKRLVFGAKDPKAGAITSLMNIPGDKRLNHRIETLGAVLEEECSFILKEFFKRLRINKKAD